MSRNHTHWKEDKDKQRKANRNWLEILEAETASRWIGQAPPIRGRRAYQPPRVNCIGQKPLYTVGEAMKWARNRHDHRS